MNRRLTYTVITAARDEAETLPRLEQALAAQTLAPALWVIAENGSTDGTERIAAEIETRHEWAQLLRVPSDGEQSRGPGIVRALHSAIAHLQERTDLIVNVDADVTFEADFFDRLVRAFEEDERLGIASGSCWEQLHGAWTQRHVTGSTVWGATRAWRRAALDDVLPFEPRVGWDGIDEFKANARGWKTETVKTLPFLHHRPEGSREATTWAARRAQGELCWFVGYRPTYVLLRAAFQLRTGFAALGIVDGYARSALTRAPQCDDRGVRAYVRRQQRLRELPRRAQEATGGASRRRTSRPDAGNASSS